MYDPSADGSSSPQTNNFRPYHNDINSIYYLTVIWTSAAAKVFSYTGRSWM